jgi:hypothetical protein
VLDATVDGDSVLSRCARGTVRRKEVVGSEAFQHLFNVARQRKSHSARGKLDIHAKVRGKYLLYL